MDFNGSQHVRSSALRVTLAVLLVLGLPGGLLHHHESGPDSAACALCHAGVQTAVADLASGLTTPFLKSVEPVHPIRSNPVCFHLTLATLVPRAPPDPIHPPMFLEGCAGLV